MLATRINTGINFIRRLLIIVLFAGPVAWSVWYFRDLDQQSRESQAMTVHLEREYCDMTDDGTRMRWEKVDTIIERLNKQNNENLPTGVWTRCDIEEGKAVDSLKFEWDEYLQLLKQHQKREMEGGK